ncbi:hypothetical protein F5X96DRAFT_695415 [Biscogniauxia mediterranea]|nr:hypothetical protein F5X96DRAFT_695415 [Biscogniauxia mediterranea]
MSPIHARPTRFSPPPPGVHQPAQSPAGQDEEEGEEDDPPCLSNMSPSIFVPATIDFSLPAPAPPSDPLERERLALAQIDEHAAAVRRNIHYLLAQETTRSRRVGSRPRPYYTALGRRVLKARGPGLTAAAAALPGGSEDDEKALARVLSRDAGTGTGAPAVEGAVVGVGLGDLVSEAIYEERAPPRRYAVTYFLNTLRNGLMQLEGHAASVERVKEEKRAEIRSEALRGRGVHAEGMKGGWTAESGGGGGGGDGGGVEGDNTTTTTTTTTTAADEGDKMDTS